MTKHKHKAPGKNYRKGMTLTELADMFPNDQAAEEWFIKQRWSDGICCHYCGSARSCRTVAGIAESTLASRLEP